MIPVYEPDSIVLQHVPGLNSPVIITDNEAYGDEFPTVWGFIEWRERKIGIKPFIFNELGFDTLADYSEYIAENPNNAVDLIMTVYDGIRAEDYKGDQLWNG